MKSWVLIGILVLLWVGGCKNSDPVAEEISSIDLDLNVKRFDRDFASAKPNDLPALRNQYPYLFPAQYNDSVWTAKMGDTLQRQLLEEVGGAFPDFEAEEIEIEMLLRHIVYYFPETVLPNIVTVTSDVDFNHRVILADSLLLIGLDNYLGPGHQFYKGISSYIAKNLDRKYLLSDIASTYANRKVKSSMDRTFLGQMIFHGKILYLKDRWMPMSTDDEKIHYSAEEMEWVEANEEQIWRYFIERELLYSTDQGLGPRFLDPAPFSKFRLELDTESPDRVGRYIGWMIVRSYMEHNDTALKDLLTLPGEEIFRKSGYKPKK